MPSRLDGLQKPFLLVPALDSELIAQDIFHAFREAPDVYRVCFAFWSQSVNIEQTVPVPGRMIKEDLECSARFVRLCF